MKRTIAAVVAVLGSVPAYAEYAMPTVSYDNLIKAGYQIIGITPDGRGGQVYHMQMQGKPLYTCRAEVLVPGLKPSLNQYCDRVGPGE